jgi:GNAT superfamily N-acetyltransferase
MNKIPAGRWKTRATLESDGGKRIVVSFEARDAGEIARGEIVVGDASQSAREFGLPGVARYLRGARIAGYITEVETVREWRGRSIGKGIVMRLAIEAIRRKATRVFLHASPLEEPWRQRQLERFYERLGFECIDSDEGDSCDTEDDAATFYLGMTASRVREIRELLAQRRAK